MALLASSHLNNNNQSHDTRERRRGLNIKMTTDLFTNVQSSDNLDIATAMVFALHSMVGHGTNMSVLA